MSKNIVCWSNPQTCADVSRKWLRGKSHFLRRKIEMMKQFILYMGICSLLLGAASCRDESATLPTGSLYLGVEEDATILTRAVTEVTDERLRVDILDAAGDTLRSYDDYYTEVRGERIVLPVGNYTVAVRSNHAGGAAWETPFYAGSESVTVRAGEITSAQVVCQITNTKVTVEYSDSVKMHFSNCETTVSNTSGSLLYTRDEYRAGYFAPEKLTTVLHLTNLDGNHFTLTRVYPDIQPRSYYRIRYSIYDEDEGDDTDNAGADFGGIEVEEKADTIYYNISIKEEELFGKGEPKLTLTGFSDEGKLTFKKTETPDVPEHAIQISAPNGVKQFRVEAVSHQFTGMESFDLCNLTDEEQSRLQALNFPLQEDMTAKEMTLELTKFAKGLEPASETVMGTHSFTFTLLDSLHQETTCTFGYDVRPNVAVTTDEPDAWAKFVTLKGNSAAPTNAGFMLRKAGDADYQRYDATSYDASTGDFSLLLTEGIEPETEYEYYAVSGTDDAGEVRRFKTSAAVNLQNNTFDDWIKDGKTWYASPTTDSHWWDSGNEGANTMNEQNPTSPEENIAVSGKAVKMETKTIFGVMASASIFTGDFLDTEDITNGVLSFGQPFISRPTKLTGYYQYKPATVSIGRNWDASVNPDLDEGDSDQCIIYVALCTKNYEIHTSPSKRKLFNPNDESVIAYGQLVADKEVTGSETNEYQKFSIDIQYRRTDIQPSYIVVVAAASRYGDYFTGGAGSTLYVDEFNLEYDYNAASFNE